MTNEMNFLGELELAQDTLLDGNLAGFAELPMIEDIWAIASAFSGRIELMPYQLDGDEMRLLVSVYLQSTSQNGNVIAVLTREPYPRDKAGLLSLIRRASNRLDSLQTLAHRFHPDSIQQAKTALGELAARIQASTLRAHL